MCCFIFNNKYFHISVHYYYLLLLPPCTVLPPSRTILIAFLTIVLNYFDYICYTTYLTGSAAYLADFTLLLHLLLLYNCASASNAMSPSPLWYQSHSFLAGDSVVVFSVSLSVSSQTSAIAKNIFLLSILVKTNAT